MENTISLETAHTLQNATLMYVNQNKNIQIAIDALKSITHGKVQTIPNTSVMNKKSEYLGISEADSKIISDFVDFLKSKEMPMRDLFNYIIRQAVSERFRGLQTFILRTIF